MEVENIKVEPVNIQAVAIGAKYCECGGMFTQDPNRGLLMSNPPQVPLLCPFCGKTDTVYNSYNVRIEFKKL